MIRSSGLRGGRNALTELEVGPWGLRDAEWSELELTASRRQFLGEPQSYLRHLT